MKIVVLCGGISTERDVSLMSGRQVYKALKGLGHDAIMLDLFLGYEGDYSDIFSKDTDWADTVAPVSVDAPDIEEVKKSRKQQNNVIFGENVLDICRMADIVFMALHGDCGENGKIQGTFDLYDIKYTGTDSLSSALAMDKDIAKKIFVTSGVNTPKGYVLSGVDDTYQPDFPCVVKASGGGSSVGVFITKDKEEYDKAVKDAFKYDNKVLVEQYIKGDEYTDCVIEGVALPVVSIEPISGFYDYKNKYQAGSTIEKCPAPISDELTKAIQAEAVKAFNALGIKTYARIDFIVDADGNIFCLEANTLPGMTPTSLVPQEAEAIGKSFPELCQWIIDISLKKYE